MSLLLENLRNVEIALAELRATIESEGMIDPEEVTNQQLFDVTNIRF